MKKRNKKINYTPENEQEWYFYYWLEELYDNGYVDYINPERPNFELNDGLKLTWIKKLKTKTKPLSKNLINIRTYTPDFIFMFNTKAKNIFYYTTTEEISSIKEFPLVSCDGFTYVDTKGEYTMHYSSSITFGDRQAIMWDKHKLYVQIVKPYIREGKGCLFEKTFTPKKVLKEQVYKQDNKIRKIKKGDSKIKYDVKTLDQFVKEQLNE